MISQAKISYSYRGAKIIRFSSSEKNLTDIGQKRKIF